MRARAQTIRYPVAMWSEREQQSPQNLAYADEHLRNQLAGDVDTTRHLPTRVSAYFSDDVARWNAGQPIIVHEVRERLWGNPETIEDVAIRLFY